MFARISTNWQWKEPGRMWPFDHFLMKVWNIRSLHFAVPSQFWITRNYHIAALENLNVGW
jgi:hypothetical protein